MLSNEIFIQMHPYYEFILGYTSMPSKDWEKIEQYLVKRTIAPNELILKEGQICRHVYFLESGFMRYFVWRDGIDVSKFFTSPPYCFTSQRSFNQQTPSKENIEALEESIIWEMNRTDAYHLFKIPSWVEFVRKLTQEVQFFTEEILEDLQNETAENRYRKMLEEGDILLEKVPLKHLASYLGIAPQSLSRIRKKLTINNLQSRSLT